MAGGAQARPGCSACAPPGAAPGPAYTLTFLAVFAQNAALIHGLPAWAAAHGLRLAPAHLANALAGLTIAAAIMLLVGHTRQFNRPAQFAVASLCGALLATVAVLAAASLVSWSPVPGVFAALALVAPCAGWLVLRLPLDRRPRTIAAAAGAGAMPACVALALFLAG